jgi:Carboxypeptidase regulatory-like domain
MMAVSQIAALVAYAVLIQCLCAQSPLGTVTGLAVDPSGQPVAGAPVVLMNQDTGTKREVPTNGSGTYSIPNLPPGRYKLTVEAAGFRPFETVVFSLAAFQTIRQDLHFQLPAASSEITVSEPV